MTSFQDTIALTSPPPMDTSSSPVRLVASDVAIGLMTGSLLLGLVGARAIANGVTQAGIASEELFRGERLPTLPIPPRSAP